MKTTIKLVILALFLMGLAMPAVVDAQYYTGLCTPNSYQRCIGNNLYWYDSCNNQQGIAQYCYNGCYNNSCNSNNNNNYNNNYNYNSSCTYHAYKLCVGSSVYWYDSCQTQQDLYLNCINGQTCQYGQCVNYVAPTPSPTPIQLNYQVYFKTACYNNSVYWYDSLGAISGLNKSCNDNNSCTIDSCSASKCLNTLKCDGTTCIAGSGDYTKSCPTVQPAKAELSVSFFEKQDANSVQWQKTIQAPSDSNVYFMISVKNDSTTEIKDVEVLANIPTEIYSLGNLKLDNVSITGDIVAGINIGTIAPTTTKSITFEGKTQTISAAADKQATATVNALGNQKTDNVSISFVASQTPAAVSKTPETPGFMAFLGRWYLWILSGLVLIFLFVVVYRRFSSES